MSTSGVCRLLLGLLLALSLTSCGEAPAPIINKTATPTRQGPISVDSPTATTPPEPLPSDIPVYPGAQLVVSERITTGTLYFYRTTAALQAVITFYTSQMPKQDWTQESAGQNTGSQGEFLVYTKDTRSVLLNIVPDPITPAQTDISITLSNS